MRRPTRLPVTAPTPRRADDRPRTCRRGGVAVEVIGLLLAVTSGLVLVATAAPYAEDNAVAAGLVLPVGLLCMQVGARRAGRPR